MFFIVFAILDRSNLLGKDKKQLNALVALVVGLIFVAAIFPKMVVGNMVLFLSIAIVVMFVGLLLWGFVSGKSGEASSLLGTKTLKWMGALIIIAVICAVLWATNSGAWLEKIFDWLVYSDWSGRVWTNVLIIVLVVGAVAIVIGKKAKP